MKTVFIRFKSLLAFGLVLLSVSTAWLAVTGWEKRQTIQALQEKEVQVSSFDAEPGPTVTIVPQDPGKTEDSFFSEYRIERERTRGEQIEILREIVSNPNSSAQMRQEAQSKLIRISDNLEKESKIENTLVAKGFKDAVVVIQQEAVMVIVSSGGLRQDEIARISDIVVKVVGCKQEDVVIVPKAP
ncbi:MAG: SpoIIIAH-like family protein [Peptococcaceae bacterium]|nr:SpoIIIAH-like family protein [Peptococcaceae bacterium]MDH7525348.1 SpoIIIAH-like family protein [Peptococcaceae bacterium]